jgi:hypothetical protein
LVASRNKNTMQRFASCGDDLLLVHVHVPKTGGTSLSNLMRDCASQRKRGFAYGHFDNFLAMSPEEQDNIIAMDAHMGYGIHLQERFPKKRVNCTFYITVSRPYAAILWSAYNYLARVGKLTQFSDPGALSRVLLDPWQFRGGLSYQLCCWGDAQHPPGSVYKNGHLVKKAGGVSPLDGTCPRTLDEAASCAMRRLCNDYHFVGSTDRLADTMVMVTKMMRCTRPAVEHANQHSDSISFDKTRARWFMDWLHANGSQQDSAVMKFAEEVSNGRRGGCEKK